MALTVQNILDKTAIDMRATLNSTTDAATMIDWVNRVNKDVMHNSVYNNILRATVHQNLTANTTGYTPIFTNFRRILAVYDNTAKRPLLPLTEGLLPVAASSPGSPSPGAGIYGRQEEALGLPWPKYYTAYGLTGISVFPAPPIDSSLGIDILYEKTATDLTAVGNTLDVPDDGKDLVVAGVNALASAYLKREADAAYWSQEYRRMMGVVTPGV